MSLEAKETIGLVVLDLVVQSVCEGQGTRERPLRPNILYPLYQGKYAEERNSIQGTIQNENMNRYTFRQFGLYLIAHATKYERWYPSRAELLYRVSLI